jgi:hypothetical protein
MEGSGAVQISYGSGWGIRMRIQEAQKHNYGSYGWIRNTDVFVNLPHRETKRPTRRRVPIVCLVFTIG